MKYIIISILLIFIPVSCAQTQTAPFKPDDLEDYINFRTMHNRYSGVTSIFDDNKVIFESVHGEANKTWNIPISSETRFNLASVTKMFTSTGIGLLIDQDMISLNEPFITYFPDFPKKEIAEKTTIAELLSHTSGISDFFFERDYLEYDRYRLRELKDYDPFFNTLRLIEVPEGRIVYSNSNYMILGRIVEKVTGQSYYEFIQKEIFDKAGMTDSGFFEADLIIPSIAEGYSRDSQSSAEFGVPNDGKLRRNLFMKAIKGMPAGGAYSTTADLNKFFQLLTNGKLLKRETYEVMTTEVQGGYAMGFQNYYQNDIEVIGHSGGFYGASSMAFHLPKLGYAFISLTNTDFGAQPVFDRFINNLAGFKNYEAISLEPEKIARYDGYFEIRGGRMEGSQIEISALEDRLLFDNNLEFFPISENEFFDIDNHQFTIKFKINENGEVTGFTRSDGREFNQFADKIDPSTVKNLQPIEVNDEVLRQYLGDYQFGEDGMMPGHKPILSIDNGALLIDNMMRFLPYEKDKFYLEGDTGMRLHFQRSDNEEVTGIHVKRQEEIIGRVEKLDGF